MYARVRELLTPEERLTLKSSSSGEEIIIDSALPCSYAYFVILAGRFLI